MVRTEQHPCSECRIGGSLNPYKIAEHLGGGIEKLLEIPIHNEYLNIVAVL